MAKRNRKGLPEELRSSMKLAGDWMRAAREGAGLSQDQIGFPTKRGKIYISEMEAGKARLTPPYYEMWAKAVGLAPAMVAQVMIGFHTPFLYEPLFGEPFSPESVIETPPPAIDHRKTAAAIRRLRGEAGISHGAMAELLDLSTRMYVAYEDGSRRVPADQLEQIALRFGVPVSALSGAVRGVESSTAVVENNAVRPEGSD
jgi:transcriptional regulator with XRE-family HTH domain